MDFINAFVDSQPMGSGSSCQPFGGPPAGFQAGKIGVCLRSRFLQLLHLFFVIPILDPEREAVGKILMAVGSRVVPQYGIGRRLGLRLV